MGGFVRVEIGFQGIKYRAIKIIHKTISPPRLVGVNIFAIPPAGLNASF